MSKYKYLPEEVTLGHEQMDTQHDRLFAIFMGINIALKTKTLGFGDHLRKLTDYIETHFQFEESLMLTSGYPDQNKHIEAHRVLADRVLELNNKYDANKENPEIIYETYEFLHSWLCIHIANVDKHFGDYLLTSSRPGSVTC